MKHQKLFLAVIATLSLNCLAADKKPAEAVSVIPSFANEEIKGTTFTNKAGFKRLQDLPETIAGDRLKDTRGCVYIVGVEKGRLKLFPFVEDGNWVCVVPSN
jgi:hypothetical protein